MSTSHESISSKSSGPYLDAASDVDTEQQLQAVKQGDKNKVLPEEPVTAPAPALTTQSPYLASSEDQPYAPGTAANIEVPPEAHVKLPDAPPIPASEAQRHPTWLEGPEHDRHGGGHARGNSNATLVRSLSRISLHHHGSHAPSGPHANLHLSKHELETGTWGFEGHRGGMEFPELAGINVDENEPEEGRPVPTEAEEEAKYEEETQHILVKWDGKDDGEHTLNMNFYYRCYLTILAGVLTLCTAFTSSAPSGIIVDMVEDFKTTPNVAKASVFLFVASFCFAPLIWAPLSETFGRRIVFIISFTGFVCFNVGCMLAPNIGSMIAFRILSGAFGSSSLSNAPAMIAGLFHIYYLMTGIVIFAIAPIAGPCIGPIISGFITDSGTDWRWLFRACTIFSFVLLLLVIFTMAETHDPIRLRMKAERLRRETGDNRYVAPIELRKVDPMKMAVQVVCKPIKMLFFEPMLMAVTIYIGFVYGTLYLLFVAYPVVFIQLHGFRWGPEGLTFLGFFVGCFLSALYCIFVDQTLYLKTIKAKNVIMLPAERRLMTSMIGAPFLTISLFWFAWTSFSSVSYWSPLVAGGMFGAGLFFIFLSLMTYITEVYLLNAASAQAANMVVRSAFGAGFPMFGEPMYHNLNPRWATTVLAFIALAMVPIPFALYKFGHKIRSLSKHAHHPS